MNHSGAKQRKVELSEIQLQKNAVQTENGNMRDRRYAKTALIKIYPYNIFSWCNLLYTTPFNLNINVSVVYL